VFIVELLLLLLLFCGVGFELRAYTLSQFTSPILIGIFEIGPLELFAWASFEQQSS
jgi:hypothetical protein